MRKRTIATISLFTFLCFVLSITIGLGNQLPPPIPDAYYGSVKINGQDAPAGSVLVAKIGSKEVGRITVSVKGQFGEENPLGTKLIVQGSNDDIGKEVIFEINGNKCNQSVIFQAGVVAKIDLTAVTSTQPPSPPPTVPSITYSASSEVKEPKKEEGPAPGKIGETIEIKTNAKNIVKISGAATITIEENTIEGINPKAVTNTIDISAFSAFSNKKIINEPFELKLENGVIKNEYSVVVKLKASLIMPNEVVEIYQINEKGETTKIKGKLSIDKNEMLFKAKQANLRIVAVATPVENIYNDVATNWAKNSIAFLTSRSIMNGYPDGTFRPRKGLTRTETATLVGRLLEIIPKTTAINIFADKDDIPVWAHNGVSACVEMGIFKGIKGEGNKLIFKPNASITRLEFAVLMGRVLKTIEGSVQPSVIRFSDKNQIPSWAQEELSLAVKYGIVTGYLDGTFRPNNIVTRDEAAAMMKRLIEVIEKNKQIKMQ